MARATGSFQFFAWWLLTLLCVQPQADHTRPEGDGRGRWEEEAQFSLQAPPDQTDRGTVRHWRSTCQGGLLVGEPQLQGFERSKEVQGRQGGLSGGSRTLKHRA